jgi:lipoprotein-anchoring transpeptidase ErfK/SrfK
MLVRLVLASFLAFLTQISAFAAASCPTLLISVPDQKLVVLQNGVPVARYPVSTSRFGIGDQPRSYATPLGKMEIAGKVGDGAPVGAVFHGCQRTGEVLKPNAPGRDPIVTRILRLKGLEAQNSRAYDRGIYIHGTPQESRIGRPASFGCIRMKSKDVVQLFNSVPVGAIVQIVNAPVARMLHASVTGTIAIKAD